MEKTQKESDVKKFLIGKAAEKSGPCPNTVKYYQTLGVIEDIRDARNRRIFSENDIKKLREFYLSRNPERA